ncbi:MAG: hypothetical protein IPN19_14465 [Elusimicrobia bacterium]|nr:hypothetical protein [Elusimicrobiota bacterium]
MGFDRVGKRFNRQHSGRAGRRVLFVAARQSGISAGTAGHCFRPGSAGLFHFPPTKGLRKRNWVGRLGVFATEANDARPGPGQPGRTARLAKLPGQGKGTVVEAGWMSGRGLAPVM